MKELLMFADSYRIRPGRLADFETAVKEITDVVEASEPRLLHYSNVIHEGGLTGTGFQIHRDYESVKRHRVVLAGLFGTIMDLTDILRIEIYGELSERRVAQIRETAGTFGPVEVVSRSFAAGFHRMPQLDG